MPQAARDVGTATPEESLRDRSIFSWYSGLLSLVILAYGYLDIGTLFDPLIGWAEVVIGFALLSNAVSLRWHGRMQVAKVAFAFLVLAVLVVIWPSGGQGGGAALWAILFPIAMFAYLGWRMASVVNGLLFLITFAFAAAQHAGVAKTYFGMETYQQMWVVMLVSNVLGYALESSQRRFRDTIVDQRERLRVLLASLPAGVVMMDPGGRVTSWNDSAGILLGRPMSTDILATGFVQTFGLRTAAGDPYPAEALPLTQVLGGGHGSMVNDVFVRRPIGNPSVLRIQAAPVHDEAGRLRGAVAVVEDATKEHDIDQMKSEFVSFASHQLKTPLTGIKWSVETLQAEGPGPLTELQRTFLGKIAESTDNLTRLVMDLLNVTRIETGRNFEVVKAQVNLRTLIAEVAAEIAAAAAKREVVVDISGLPTDLPREVDAAKMREVFLNLIGNAVKYSKPGGRVTVGMDGPAVSIADDGIGIPSSQQARVFDRFFRAENAATVEGTGLGLYIVRAIVERHGGTVRFRSEEGKGTTFLVTV